MPGPLPLLQDACGPPDRPTDRLTAFPPRRLHWPRLLTPWLRHRQSGLRTEGQNFMLEDSTFWIFGGSVHYFRVPRAYWRDRLLKMKACGLNTLTT